MLTRATVLEHIQQLPEQFSIDDLMEKIFFLYKLELALEQSKNGKVKSHQEIKEKYQQWLG